MGRHNLTPSTVHKHATALLQASRLTHPPPWYTAISQNPPPQILVRKPLQRPQKPGKKSSRLFHPVQISYAEDQLRWEYFNDHPWELSRPRVVLEEDGRDRQRWDWSVPLDESLRQLGNKERRAGTEYKRSGGGFRLWEATCEKQAGRPLNGEAVVQRQHWLLTHTGMTPAAAYDKARKELYRIRHYQETERRVAREEALASGAFFGPGPNEVGMLLEDRTYEAWKNWAEKETDIARQLRSSAYAGAETEESEVGVLGEEEAEVVGQEVSGSVPGSKAGQAALGGAVAHP